MANHPESKQTSKVVKNMNTASKHQKAKTFQAKLKRGLKEIAVMGAIILVISIGMDWWRNQSIPENEFSPMALQTTQGQTINPITESFDKPVVLYFWATWCGACRFVSPSINWLTPDNESQYALYSVAMTSGENARVNAYMKHHDYHYPVINDPSGQLGRTFGILATPSIVILRDGKVVSATTGVTTPPGIWARIVLAS
ncbi:hypothetical protein A3K86_21545 [Photobacterium jeanii]|uniref:Thioredoxin domain-containing protein n=1 Tax=Photobacterium jeanii TaxID=858640 RepID=A0A178K342_9GAMM|nr:protein disulfide oxidoreductase [Photobacterium jeanii]OAN11516.1 hypothetical protein A3K86_21545 [Photobacterium jeanii]